MIKKVLISTIMVSAVLIIVIARNSSASMYLDTELPESRISLNYFGMHTVESIFQEGSYLPGSKTGPTMSNAFFLNYRPNKTQILGFVFGVEIYPVNVDRSFLYNPAVRFGDSELIINNYVKLSSDFRVIIPLNDEAKKTTDGNRLFKSA